MMSRRPALALLSVIPLMYLPVRGGELEDYVKRSDPSFQWSVTGEQNVAGNRVVSIALTSQTWQDIVWKHDVRVYVPGELRYPDTVLLFVTGGSTDSKPKDSDHAMGISLANACGARVAVLPQVPNQPLLGGKVEDDLISETFLRYLETNDATWPLLLPMVKSAVRAMDAVQGFAKADGKPVQTFVVTGASKRGWTTWLTGANDARVIGIAPMVIPTLNFHKQNPHQIETWGAYSEQIQDYVRKGLMEKLESEGGKKLTKIVDPYFYLNQIKIPVLQINGTNDPYWTLDSMNLFWDDIHAPKHVVYLPNAGHGLDKNREWAIQGIGSLFRSAASKRPLPQLTWEVHAEAKGDATTLVVHADPPPKAAALWFAEAETLDFREVPWSSVPAPAPGSSMRFTRDHAPKKHSAMFADLTFSLDGLEYHLSTQIQLMAPAASR